jgi:RNA polymerase sigma-70 factor (ECF subfamily)
MRETSETSEAREVRWRAWMVAAQDGDAVAYEKLLHELLPHLRRFVRRRVFDAALLEDVVQNVFLSLHRARHTYRSERPFSPWFYAIARNAVTDHVRSRGRRASREISLEEEGVPEPAVEPVLPREDALSPELERALAALSPGQRDAVEMIHVEGLSVKEAAARAGVSQSALKVRAHRGYRALRAKLGGRDALGVDDGE